MLSELPLSPTIKAYFGETRAIVKAGIAQRRPHADDQRRLGSRFDLRPGSETLVLFSTVLRVAEAIIML